MEITLILKKETLRHDDIVCIQGFNKIHEKITLHLLITLFFTRFTSTKSQSLERAYKPKMASCAPVTENVTRSHV